MPVDYVQWIFRNYEELLNEEEWNAHLHYSSCIHADCHEENPEGWDAPTRKAHAGKMRQQFPTPEAEALLAHGYRAFQGRAVRRLVRENRAKILLNRCPRCNRIPGTPVAKQCPVGGHAWRDADLK